MSQQAHYEQVERAAEWFDDDCQAMFQQLGLNMQAILKQQIEQLELNKESDDECA